MLRDPSTITVFAELVDELSAHQFKIWRDNQTVYRRMFFPSFHDGLCQRVFSIKRPGSVFKSLCRIVTHYGCPL